MMQRIKNNKLQHGKKKDAKKHKKVKQHKKHGAPHAVLTISTHGVSTITSHPTPLTPTSSGRRRSSAARLFSTTTQQNGESTNSTGNEETSLSLYTGSHDNGQKDKSTTSNLPQEVKDKFSALQTEVTAFQELGALKQRYDIRPYRQHLLQLATNLEHVQFTAKEKMLLYDSALPISHVYSFINYKTYQLRISKLKSEKRTNPEQSLDEIKLDDAEINRRVPLDYPHLRPKPWVIPPELYPSYAENEIEESLSISNNILKLSSFIDIFTNLKLKKKHPFGKKRKLYDKPEDFTTNPNNLTFENTIIPYELAHAKLQSLVNTSELIGDLHTNPYVKQTVDHISLRTGHVYALVVSNPTIHKVLVEYVLNNDEIFTKLDKDQRILVITIINRLFKDYGVRDSVYDDIYDTEHQYNNNPIIFKKDGSGEKNENYLTTDQQHLVPFTQIRQFINKNLHLLQQAEIQYIERYDGVDPEVISIYLKQLQHEDKIYDDKIQDMLKQQQENARLRKRFKKQRNHLSGNNGNNNDDDENEKTDEKITDAEEITDDNEDKDDDDNNTDNKSFDLDYIDIYTVDRIEAQFPNIVEKKQHLQYLVKRRDETTRFLHLLTDSTIPEIVKNLRSVEDNEEADVAATARSQQQKAIHDVVDNIMALIDGVITVKRAKTEMAKDLETLYEVTKLRLDRFKNQKRIEAKASLEVEQTEEMMKQHHQGLSELLNKRPPMNTHTIRPLMMVTTGELDGLSRHDLEEIAIRNSPFITKTTVSPSDLNKVTDFSGFDFEANDKHSMWASGWEKKVIMLTNSPEEYKLIMSKCHSDVLRYRYYMMYHFGAHNTMGTHTRQYKANEIDELDEEEMLKQINKEMGYENSEDDDENNNNQNNNNNDDENNNQPQDASIVEDEYDENGNTINNKKVIIENEKDARKKIKTDLTYDVVKNPILNYLDHYESKTVNLLSPHSIMGDINNILTAGHNSKIMPQTIEEFKNSIKQVNIQQLQQSLQQINQIKQLRATNEYLPYEEDLLTIASDAVITLRALLAHITKDIDINYTELKFDIKKTIYEQEPTKKDLLFLEKLKSQPRNYLDLIAPHTLLGSSQNIQQFMKHLYTIAHHNMTFDELQYDYQNLLSYEVNKYLKEIKLKRTTKRLKDKLTLEECDDDDNEDKQTVVDAEATVESSNDNDDVENNNNNNKKNKKQVDNDNDNDDDDSKDKTDNSEERDGEKEEEEEEEEEEETNNLEQDEDYNNILHYINKYTINYYNDSVDNKQGGQLAYVYTANNPLLLAIKQNAYGVLRQKAKNDIARYYSKRREFSSSKDYEKSTNATEIYVPGMVDPNDPEAMKKDEEKRLTKNKMYDINDDNSTFTVDYLATNTTPTLTGYELNDDLLATEQDLIDNMNELALTRIRLKQSEANLKFKLDEFNDLITQKGKSGDLKNFENFDPNDHEMRDTILTPARIQIAKVLIGDINDFFQQHNINHHLTGDDFNDIQYQDQLISDQNDYDHGLPPMSEEQLKNVMRLVAQQKSSDVQQDEFNREQVYGDTMYNDIELVRNDPRYMKKVILLEWSKYIRQTMKLLNKTKNTLEKNKKVFIHQYYHQYVHQLKLYRANNPIMDTETGNITVDASSNGNTGDLFDADGNIKIPPHEEEQIKMQILQQLEQRIKPTITTIFPWEELYFRRQLEQSLIEQDCSYISTMSGAIDSLGVIDKSTKEQLLTTVYDMKKAQNKHLLSHIFKEEDERDEQQKQKDEEQLKLLAEQRVINEAQLKQAQIEEAESDITKRKKIIEEYQKNRRQRLQKFDDHVKQMMAKLPPNHPQLRKLIQQQREERQRAELEQQEDDERMALIENEIKEEESKLLINKLKDKNNNDSNVNDNKNNKTTDTTPTTPISYVNKNILDLFNEQVSLKSTNTDEQNEKNEEVIDEMVEYRNRIFSLFNRYQQVKMKHDIEKEQLLSVINIPYNDLEEQSYFPLPYVLHNMLFIFETLFNVNITQQPTQYQIDPKSIKNIYSVDGGEQQQKQHDIISTLPSVQSKITRDGKHPHDVLYNYIEDVWDRNVLVFKLKENSKRKTNLNQINSIEDDNNTNTNNDDIPESTIYLDLFARPSKRQLESRYIDCDYYDVYENTNYISQQKIPTSLPDYLKHSVENRKKKSSTTEEKEDENGSDDNNNNDDIIDINTYYVLQTPEYRYTPLNNPLKVLSDRVKTKFFFHLLGKQVPTSAHGYKNDNLLLSTINESIEEHLNNMNNDIINLWQTNNHGPIVDKIEPNHIDVENKHDIQYLLPLYHQYTKQALGYDEWSKTKDYLNELSNIAYVSQQFKEKIHFEKLKKNQLKQQQNKKDSEDEDENNKNKQGKKLSTSKYLLQLDVHKRAGYALPLDDLDAIDDRYYIDNLIQHRLYSNNNPKMSQIVQTSAQQAALALEKGDTKNKNINYDMVDPKKAKIKENELTSLYLSRAAAKQNRNKAAMQQAHLSLLSQTFPLHFDDLESFEPITVRKVGQEMVDSFEIAEDGSWEQYMIRKQQGYENPIEVELIRNTIKQQRLQLSQGFDNTATTFNQTQNFSTPVLLTNAEVKELFVKFGAMLFKTLNHNGSNRYSITSTTSLYKEWSNMFRNNTASANAGNTSVVDLEDLNSVGGHSLSHKLQWGPEVDAFFKSLAESLLIHDFNDKFGSTTTDGVNRTTTSTFISQNNNTNQKVLLTQDNELNLQQKLLNTMEQYYDKQILLHNEQIQELLKVKKNNKNKKQQQQQQEQKDDVKHNNDNNNKTNDNTNTIVDVENTTTTTTTKQQEKQLQPHIVAKKQKKKGDLLMLRKDLKNLVLDDQQTNHANVQNLKYAYSTLFTPDDQSHIHTKDLNVYSLLTQHWSYINHGELTHIYNIYNTDFSYLQQKYILGLTKKFENDENLNTILDTSEEFFFQNKGSMGSMALKDNESLKTEEYKRRENTTYDMSEYQVNPFSSNADFINSGKTRRQLKQEFEENQVKLKVLRQRYSIALYLSNFYQTKYANFWENKLSTSFAELNKIMTTYNEIIEYYSLLTNYNTFILDLYDLTRDDDDSDDNDGEKQENVKDEKKKNAKTKDNKNNKQKLNKSQLPKDILNEKGQPNLLEQDEAQREALRKDIKHYQNLITTTFNHVSQLLSSTTAMHHTNNAMNELILNEVGLRKATGSDVFGGDNDDDALKDELAALEDTTPQALAARHEEGIRQRLSSTSDQLAEMMDEHSSNGLALQKQALYREKIEQLKLKMEKQQSELSALTSSSEYKLPSIVTTSLGSLFNPLKYQSLLYGIDIDFNSFEQIQRKLNEISSYAFHSDQSLANNQFSRTYLDSNSAKFFFNKNHGRFTEGIRSLKLYSERMNRLIEDNNKEVLHKTSPEALKDIGPQQHGYIKNSMKNYHRFNRDDFQHQLHLMLKKLLFRYPPKPSLSFYNTIIRRDIQHQTNVKHNMALASLLDHNYHVTEYQPETKLIHEGELLKQKIQKEHEEMMNEKIREKIKRQQQAEAGEEEKENAESQANSDDNSEEEHGKGNNESDNNINDASIVDENGNTINNNNNTEENKKTKKTNTSALTTIKKPTKFDLTKFDHANTQSNIMLHQNLREKQLRRNDLGMTFKEQEDYFISNPLQYHNTYNYSANNVYNIVKGLIPLKPSNKQLLNKDIYKNTYIDAIFIKNSVYNGKQFLYNAARNLSPPMKLYKQRPKEATHNILQVFTQYLFRYRTSNQLQQKLLMKQALQRANSTLLIDRLRHKRETSLTKRGVLHFDNVPPNFYNFIQNNNVDVKAAKRQQIINEANAREEAEDRAAEEQERQKEQQEQQNKQTQFISTAGGLGSSKDGQGINEKAIKFEQTTIQMKSKTKKLFSKLSHTFTSLKNNVTNTPDDTANSNVNTLTEAQSFTPDTRQEGNISNLNRKEELEKEKLEKSTLIFEEEVELKLKPKQLSPPVLDLTQQNRKYKYLLPQYIFLSPTLPTHVQDRHKAKMYSSSLLLNKSMKEQYEYKQSLSSTSLSNNIYKLLKHKLTLPVIPLNLERFNNLIEQVKQDNAKYDFGDDDDGRYGIAKDESEQLNYDDNQEGHEEQEQQQEEQGQESVIKKPNNKKPNIIPNHIAVYKMLLDLNHTLMSAHPQATPLLQGTESVKLHNLAYHQYLADPHIAAQVYCLPYAQLLADIVYTTQFQSGINSTFTNTKDKDTNSKSAKLDNNKNKNNNKNKRTTNDSTNTVGNITKDNHSFGKNFLITKYHPYNSAIFRIDASAMFEFQNHQYLVDVAQITLSDDISKLNAIDQHQQQQGQHKISNNDKNNNDERIIDIETVQMNDNADQIIQNLDNIDNTQPPVNNIDGDIIDISTEDGIKLKKDNNNTAQEAINQTQQNNNNNNTNKPIEKKKLTVGDILREMPHSYYKSSYISKPAIAIMKLSCNDQSLDRIETFKNNIIKPLRPYNVNNLLSRFMRIAAISTAVPEDSILLPPELKQIGANSIIQRQALEYHKHMYNMMLESSPGTSSAPLLGDGRQTPALSFGTTTGKGTKRNNTTEGGLVKF